MGKQLDKELGRIFAEEMAKVVKREIEEPDYLRQEDYDSCEDRAVAMIYDAIPRVRDVLTLAIAKHRQVKHEEDRNDEVERVSANLDPEDVSVGLMSFWNH